MYLLASCMKYDLLISYLCRYLQTHFLTLSLALRIYKLSCDVAFKTLKVYIRNKKVQTSDSNLRADG